MALCSGWSNILDIQRDWNTSRVVLSSVRVLIAPPANFYLLADSQLAAAKVEGSQNGLNWTTLGTAPAPHALGWTNFEIASEEAFRFVRYYASNSGKYQNFLVNELQFVGIELVTEGPGDCDVIAEVSFRAETLQPEAFLAGEMTHTCRQFV